MSSHQFDSLERGFSFRGEKLDMRMNAGAGMSAHELLKNTEIQDLAAIFRDFGEIFCAQNLAFAVKKFFINHEKMTAKNFNEILANFGGKKLVALAYQALRIAVNAELSELQVLLNFVQKLAADPKNSAKICVISFHSLEDRLVKNAFKNLIKLPWVRALGKKITDARPKTDHLAKSHHHRSKSPRAPQQKAALAHFHATHSQVARILQTLREIF